jgi:hypothetical protein
VAHTTKRLFLYIAILTFGASYSPDVVFAKTTPDTIIIHAVVPPHRYAILNQKNEIQQVLSNTPLDILPVFTIGAADGQKKESTPELLKSYNTLTRGLDFSKPGVIYERQQTINPEPLYVAIQFIAQFLMKIS